MTAFDSTRREAPRLPRDDFDVPFEEALRWARERKAVLPEEFYGARLQAVREGMNQLKSSRQAVMSYGMLSALGIGPASVQKPALEMLSRKATAVATNVPGPPVPLYLCGTRVAEMMFWVPQSGTIGMGISILSYSGSVYFGLIADTKLVPDPESIIVRFGPELEKLLLIALMHDSEQPITAESAEHLLHASGKVGKSRSSRQRPRRSRSAPM